MRLTISVDANPHQIDSTDPETLGRWIVEIFGRIKTPTPATYIRVEAWPSFVEDANGQYRPDWIADTRWIRTGSAESPRELLNLLTEWLDDYEAGISVRDDG